MKSNYMTGLWVLLVLLLLILIIGIAAIQDLHHKLS